MKGLILRLDGQGPLYQQLAQAIRELIRRGELKKGDRLPTVRALFQQTGLSDGTIRHAYELLAREGVLTLTQGKGTFVNDLPGPASREALAMESIDQMIHALTGLGFSPREIQLYVNVKLSRRQEGSGYLPVAVVDCNSESLNQAALQLSGLQGVELTEYLLQDVRRAPGQLLAGFPLVVTTHSHYPEIRALAGEKARAVMACALSPSPDTLVELARVPQGKNLLLYCRSARFLRIMQEGLALIPGMQPAAIDSLLAGEEQRLEPLLQKAHVLITSPDYLTYATHAQQQALARFTQRGGKLIPYRYQLDQGSLNQISLRIRALRENAPAP